MCLDLKSKFSFKRTAKKDIIVYKHINRGVSDNVFITPYRDCLVSLGNEYESELIKPKNCKYVGTGLHSFKNIQDCLFDAVDEKSSCVVSCIIPKGAKYYSGIFRSRFNSLQSYASDKIIYDSIVIDMAKKYRKNID